MALSSRQKAFFLIAIKQRPKDAPSLFSFLPQDEKEEMNAMYQSLVGHKEKSVKKVATSELVKFARPHNLSFLADVHDDWIIDMLLQETPEMIATILRYMPAERVRVIVNALPVKVLDQMPKLAEVYSIPSSLAELLKQKFESFFSIDKIYSPGNKFEFEHFCLLRFYQIHDVFLELGYREIALGLTSLPEDAQVMVMERLSVSDRQRVQYYLKDISHVSTQRMKRAQIHLVDKDLDPKSPVSFIKELGFVLYAKSLLPKDQDQFHMILKKLSKVESEFLKSLVTKQLGKNTEASVLSCREDVMIAVRIVLGKK